MATSEELRHRIVSRYIARTDITAAQLLEALTGLDAGQRVQFLQEVNSNRAERAGRVLLAIRNSYLERLAEAEADRILEDGTIDFDEIDKVL